MVNRRPSILPFPTAGGIRTQAGISRRWLPRLYGPGLGARSTGTAGGSRPSSLLSEPVAGTDQAGAVEAPFFQGAKLLIAADCTAYARADFHRRFMDRRITLIGCPKLDEGDYAEKLTEIIRRNDIREVTVVRMDVPCCGGIQRAAETALQNSGKFIP